MRVKDLIKSLRKLNPEAPVYYTTGKSRMNFYQVRYVEHKVSTQSGFCDDFVTIASNKCE